jgi:hypothetical protein
MWTPLAWAGDHFWTTWGGALLRALIVDHLGNHLGWTCHSGGATNWVDALLVELLGEPRGLVPTTRVNADYAGQC